MVKERILYVSQEITPYLPENDLSKTSRFLPQAMNESGIDVRLFMPRFGCINERRHQLHEVIQSNGEARMQLIRCVQIDKEIEQNYANEIMLT